MEAQTPHHSAETPSWTTLLGPEKQKPYFKALCQRVQQARQQSTVYPAAADVFNAFKYTPLDQLKVVIIGQDPYHGPGQAHGLSFSVPAGIAIPPSLRNIYQELHNDLGITPPKHGCLRGWAEQGVLLLNSVLTVAAGSAASHANFGWTEFTDTVINQLNQHCSNLVFLLWGSHAHRKGAQLNPSRHIIFKTTHPSPLSAHRGFLGCRHFSKANVALAQHNKSPIDWRYLPNT